MNYAHEGHMKPLTAQKKLIEIGEYPSCGAFYRGQECELSEAQGLVEEHIDEINLNLGLNEDSYTVIRCWPQIVQGTNYFMHAESRSGKKVTIGMYVPLDYGEEGEEEGNIVDHDYDEEREKLEFEIWTCELGHNKMEM